MNGLSVNELYGCNEGHFARLFIDSMDGVEARNTVQQLQQSFFQGNLGALDVLAQVSLRDDALGHEAEKTLFGLYKDGSNTTVKEQILAVYGDLSNLILSSSMIKECRKIQQPSLSSYLMCMAKQCIMDCKKAISSMLNDCFFQGHIRDELWGKGRYIRDDEITATCIQHPNFACCISLEEPEILANLLACTDYTQGFRYFPVLHKEHWMLLGLSQERAFLFTSNGSIDQQAETILKTALARLGITQYRSLVYSLQAEVPNGCGLFICAAINKIMANHEMTPEEIIKNFAESFLSSESEEKLHFDESMRALLFQCMLDRYSNR